MKRTNKKLPLEEDEKSLVLPPLNALQFSTKLDDLLSKVSIQNRYAQRISQCNIKNMQQLQRARQELQRVAEERKMKQLRAGNEHDLFEQVMRRVNTSEQELKNVFKQLVDAKREIKNLKKEITNLQKSNLQLQRQLMAVKRERYYQISTAKQEVENSLLSTEVKTYLSASNQVGSILYQHCLAAFKQNEFTNFLQTLESKLQAERGEGREKKCSREHCLREDRYSGLKLKLSRGNREREQRFRTEHISHPKIRL